MLSLSRRGTPLAPSACRRHARRPPRLALHEPRLPAPRLGRAQSACSSCPGATLFLLVAVPGVRAGRHHDHRSGRLRALARGSTRARPVRPAPIHIRRPCRVAGDRVSNRVILINVVSSHITHTRQPQSTDTPRRPLVTAGPLTCKPGTSHTYYTHTSSL